MSYNDYTSWQTVAIGYFWLIQQSLLYLLLGSLITTYFGEDILRPWTATPGELSPFTPSYATVCLALRCERIPVSSVYGITTDLENLAKIGPVDFEINCLKPDRDR